jgi:hypothetical protein
MTRKQFRVLQALNRVQAFLDTNTADLGEVSATGTRDKLEAAIAEMELHAAGQDPLRHSRRGEQASQWRLRTAIRELWMIPIVRIGRAQELAELRALLLPPANANIQGFLEAARGIAATATRHAEVFVSEAMPADFAERFSAAIDELEATVGERQNTRGLRSGASEGLRAAVTKGLRALAILDALIVPRIKGDRALLGTWQAVRKVWPVGRRGDANQGSGESVEGQTAPSVE